MREVGRPLRAQETSALSEAEPEEEDQGARSPEEGVEATGPGKALQRLRHCRMAGRDRSDVVEAVRASADLREIVSEYLPLKKSGGAKYRALCPFHTEKTPSFWFDADKQLFYCFGCGAGGDIFKFLMLYEKMEFPEALRTLAVRYGIPIP